MIEKKGSQIKKKCKNEALRIPTQQPLVVGTCSMVSRLCLLSFKNISTHSLSGSLGHLPKRAYSAWIALGHTNQFFWRCMSFIQAQVTLFTNAVKRNVFPQHYVLGAVDAIYKGCIDSGFTFFYIQTTASQNFCDKTLCLKLQSLTILESDNRE